MKTGTPSMSDRPRCSGFREFHIVVYNWSSFKGVALAPETLQKLVYRNLNMPAKDIYHESVKNALIKDGWTITQSSLTRSGR